VGPGPRPPRLAPGKVRQVPRAGATRHVFVLCTQRSRAVWNDDQKMPGSTSSDIEENCSSDALR